MLTGGIVGAIIAAAVISVFVVLPAVGDDDEYEHVPSSAVTNGHGNPEKLSETQVIPPYMQQGTIEGGMSFVEVFEKVEPSVVRIDVQRSEQIETNDGGVGSGFLYDKKGHIVTNAHVIREAESIDVTFLDDRIFEAELVGVDKFTDIAVIKIDAGSATLQPLTFGDSSGLKVGEQIIAIGNPFGLSGSMSAGIISQTGRLLPSNAGYSIPDIIQTDAAINPGNSGGPLLNMRGEVVGVNNAIQSTTGEFAGVGFALPSQTIVKIAPTLITDGTYAHPWVGISGMSISPEIAGLMGLEEATGFLVVEVIEGGPADEIELQPSLDAVTIRGEEIKIGGDVILGIDGEEVRKIDDILLHLQRVKSVGDPLNLEILRDGQIIERTLTLQQRPD